MEDAPIARAPGSCNGEGRFTCSTEGRALLVCTGGKLAERGPCRGPKGCVAGASDVACDDTIGEEGDPCEVVGQLSCSVDKTRELTCRESGGAKKLAVSRVCRAPCSASEGELRCD